MEFCKCCLPNWLVICQPEVLLHYQPLCFGSGHCSPIQPPSQPVPGRTFKIPVGNVRDKKAGDHNQTISQQPAIHRSKPVGLNMAVNQQTVEENKEWKVPQIN